MDRFIEFCISNLQFFIIGLKSNMDRFIANLQSLFLIILESLKSNMDRFIVNVWESAKGADKFKIQYG